MGPAGSGPPAPWPLPVPPAVVPAVAAVRIGEPMGEGPAPVAAVVPAAAVADVALVVVVLAGCGGVRGRAPTRSECCEADDELVSTSSASPVTCDVCASVRCQQGQTH